MGKPVTVDSDDLECLLQASVAAVQIESILKTLRQDPALIRMEAKGQIAAAHSRINRARADAIKPEELRLPEITSVRLTIEERDQLEHLARWPTASGVKVLKPDKFGTLFMAGFAERGQANEYATFNGDKVIEPMEYQRVRITPRGRQWLELHR
jgi:hypothetical protein